MPSPLRHLTTLILVALASLATSHALEPLPDNRRPQTIPGPTNNGKLELIDIDREDALRLQIFLDQSHFGPGVIDGRIGTFTKLAVSSWCAANGHPDTDWSPILKAARKAVKKPYATAIVPDSALEWVDWTLPLDKPGQAERKRMSYRRISEFMAERYHTDENFLRSINGTTEVNQLRVGSALLVPNISPFLIENITGKSHPKEDQLSLRHIVVDTKIKQVSIFEPSPAALIVQPTGKLPKDHNPHLNPGLIASFPITPGRSEVIRHGHWELRNMVELPWWRYDQTFLDTGERGPEEEWLNIPPGPNSPVGIIWNGTSRKGIGLHGTSDPHTIGRARSSGCIRLCNWDAIRLPNLVRPGATVEIR